MLCNDSIVPRLSRGVGDGVTRMCAMQAVSLLNGDTEVTDYPTCSARPLARLVQVCNDKLAGPDEFLTPENSVLVLDLGWRTVGTADVSDDVVHAWMAEFLTNPVWGVIRFIEGDVVEVVQQVADLHRRAARGDLVEAAAWSAARDAAWPIAWSTTGATKHAAQSVAESAAWSATSPAWSVADAATAVAEAAASIVDFAHHAIASWRDLAGLDTPADIDTNAVNSAFAQLQESK